jgi:hypothetical protein
MLSSRSRVVRFAARTCIWFAARCRACSRAPFWATRRSAWSRTSARRCADSPGAIGVVVCSPIGCGTCSYCRAGYYAQCDTANPNGPSAGTSFFGGPESTGPADGLQAQYACIPFAMTTLVRIPDGVTDDQAILISDIFPTAWFGARLAEVGAGDSVLVLGAGVVGQFAIASAKRQGAGRVFVVDGSPLGWTWRGRRTPRRWTSTPRTRWRWSRS